MDQRAEYLIQILEKIGSPLMASITAKITDEGGEESARTMAALLTRSVQTSIDMANATELAAAGVQDDSLRVALTALASPLVAGLFERNAKIPEDADLKKITTSLQAVLSFAENFAPNQENTQRLIDIAAQGQPADAHQVNIQYIHALTPIINVSGAFSFGQSEQKLVMDITSKLVAKAATMRASLFGEMPEDEQKITELALLRTLAEIYAACHDAETNRLMTMDDEERANQPQAPGGGGLALDNVWKAFDLRMSMLEALAQNILPGTNSNQAPAPVAEAAAPVAEASAKTPPAAAAPQAQEQPTAPPAGGGSSPMAMFAAPKNTEDTAPAETPPPAAAQEPAVETPVEAPPAAPATEAAQTPADSSAEKVDSGNSPMTFFSQKPKNDDES